MTRTPHLHVPTHTPLELCPSGSLMKMRHHGHVFTEQEVRFFIVQLIGARHYMHTHQVIRRDLKLGNLFLDANMNISWRFWLGRTYRKSRRAEEDHLRHTQLIVSEILFNTTNGHSFEADTWSIGVILYTFVVSQPPFQTKDINVYQ